MSAESRLAEMGLTLPEVTQPVANYVLARRSGGHLFLSGHLGKREGKLVRGRVGEDVSKDEAYVLARGAAIDLLASARVALGGLEAISGVAKVTGFVNSAPDFIEQSAVVNGASDLLVEVFGDGGKHARSSIGVAQLPLGAAVEIEAVFELA